MSNESSLDVKIRALVEGVENVRTLASELLTTGDAARDAGEEARIGAQGLGEVSQQANTLPSSLNDVSAGLAATGDAARSAGEDARSGAQGIAEVSQQASALPGALSDVGAGFAATGDAARSASDAAHVAAQGLGEVGDQVNALPDALNDAGAGFEDLGQSTDNLPGALSDTAENLDRVASSAKESNSGAIDAANGLTDLNSAASGLPNALDDVGSGLGLVSSAAHNASDSALDGSLGLLSIRDAAREMRDPVRSAMNDLSETSIAAASNIGGVADANNAASTQAESVAKAFADVVGQLEALKKSFDEAAQSMGEATRQTEQQEAAARQLPTIFSQLKDNLLGLVGLFGALAAAYGLKESADYAARTEVLGTTLGVVAKNAGYSAEQISAYEAQVKKLGITTQATRESLTQMIQAGLELGPAAAGQVAQVAQLARAAQDLAVVTGESSSETLNQLITNIAQLDTEGLRFMGLTISVEQAQARFALQIGKTTDELTQQQKTQAVTNAVLEKAATLQGAYEASMQNVGKQIASITRYQEELANDIGAKLLPAYFELVKVATDFLKVADQIVKSADEGGKGAQALAEGTKVFFGGLADLLQSVLSTAAQVMPFFEMVMGIALQFSGEVLEGLGAILQLGDSVEASGRRVSALGIAINDTIIIPLGIFIAGLRDGFSILGAVIAYMTAAGAIFQSSFLQGLGKIVGFFNGELGQAISGAGDKLRETADELLGYANDTVEKFGRGETALGQFNAKLADSKAAAAALAQASSFTDIEEQIRRLTEAKRQSSMTDVELKRAAEDVAQAIKRLGEETDATTGKTKLSEAQVQKLGQALLNVTKDSASQFNEAINSMGFKLRKFGDTQYLVPLSKEFEAMAGEALKLADSATATSLQFKQAFSKGLGAAKTLSDIEMISASLKNASVAGKDLAGSAGEVVGQFEKVFAASLKAAGTKEDLALLTAEIGSLGDKGLISGQLVSKALDAIKEKSEGARSESALLARQLTEVGKSAVDIGRAHLGVVQAEYHVGRARIDVWKAGNKYAKDGTDLAREELRLAELTLQLAEAKAAEARTAYAEAQQSGRVLIAQQEQILAIKRLERDLDNEKLILAKEAASKALEGAQAAYEVAKQRAQAQAELVIKVEEEMIRQKLVVEQVAAVAEQTRQAASHASSVAGQAREISTGLTSAAASAEKLSSGMMSASGAAAELTGNLRGATDQQLRLQSAINSTAAAQIRLDQAMGASSGSGVLGDGGLAARNAGVKSNTGEKKNYASAQESFTLSSEENRYWDFLEGKGKLTEQDRAYVEGKWSAAQANLQTMQANNGAYSSGGYQSAVQKYNEARRAYESLNAPTSKTADFGVISNNLISSIGARNAGVSTAIPAAAQAALGTPQSPAPGKVIQVNLNQGAQTVPMTTDAGNEQNLLAILQSLQKVSM